MDKSTERAGEGAVRFIEDSNCTGTVFLMNAKDLTEGESAVREFPKVIEIDEDGELQTAPWGGVSLASVYGVHEKADSHSVLKRLSDNWRIDFKVSQSKRTADRMTRIDAMLHVLYAEPIKAAFKRA